MVAGSISCVCVLTSVCEQDELAAWARCAVVSGVQAHYTPGVYVATYNVIRERPTRICTTRLNSVSELPEMIMLNTWYTRMQPVGWAMHQHHANSSYSGTSCILGVYAPCCHLRQPPRSPAYVPVGLTLHVSWQAQHHKVRAGGIWCKHVQPARQQPCTQNNRTHILGGRTTRKSSSARGNPAVPRS